MSTPIITRDDFQTHADAKLDEAEVLLNAGRWSGALYLAGYAVELAIKACIIKKLMATDAFPDKEFSRKCYTHELKELFKQAGLTAAFGAALAADTQLNSNWLAVSEWSEAYRYERADEVETRTLLGAISHPVHGVLTWVKTYW